MSYIGNTPTSIAFLTDLFTGTGSLSVFTMSAAPASTSSILVSITGVLQEPSTYSVSGNTLTFSQAPPAGTGNISVRYLGIPASNIVSTAYRTVTDFTATLAQTIFTVPSYTVGYITVYRNGARLGAADYTATNGTTVVLTVAANTGDLVTTESFYVSSVLNAIPAVAGAVTSSYIVPNVTLSSPSYTGTLTGGTGILNIGSGQLYKDASGNVGIGTSSPSSFGKLAVVGSNTGGAIVNYFSNSWTTATANTQVVLSLDPGGNGYGVRDCQIRAINNGVNQNSLTFYTSNAATPVEALRIDFSGNLLVGTTSPTNSSKLSIYAGATTGTTYNVSAATGGSVVTNQQQSTSVSTSAVVILTPNQYASFCVVFGSDGTNRFMDLILCGLGTGTIQVVSSFTVSGSPAARTYTQSSSTYRLAMGSGTYTVKVSTITMDG